MHMKDLFEMFTFFLHCAQRFVLYYVLSYCHCSANDLVESLRCVEHGRVQVRMAL
jgi:hypothetical protein